MLAGFAPGLAEQPCNRGTAAAILFGLRHLVDLGRDATVAVFPSDHFIGNDDAFMSQVSLRHPDLKRVNRFWEKPSESVADHLFRGGCLWNSFILVASVAVLHAMFVEFASQLYCTFNAELAATIPGSDGLAVERAYRKTPTEGFSEQILSQYRSNLVVLKLENCQWSDLGEPSRVLDLIKNLKRHPR